MRMTADACGDFVGEDIARQSVADRCIDARDVGQTSAKHDDLWIEDVDHAREPPRDPIVVTFKRRQSRSVSGRCTAGDFGGGKGLTGFAPVVCGQAGARTPGLDTAIAAALAARPGRFFRR